MIENAILVVVFAVVFDAILILGTPWINRGPS